MKPAFSSELTKAVAQSWRTAPDGHGGLALGKEAQGDAPALATDWAADLRGAMGEIAARQRELDGGSVQVAIRQPPGEDEAGPARPKASAGSPASLEMSRFEQQLRAMTMEIQSLRRPCGVQEAFAALRRELMEFDRRLKDALPRSVLERIERLAQHIEALAASIASRASGAAPAVPGFERLERRINGLAQKLDASEARLDSLSGIQGSMTDLITQLQAARGMAIEVAAVAAKAAVEEGLRARSTSEGELAQLRHDMALLRTAQADIDRRVASALEAVHDTLNRLVERMALSEAHPNPSRKPRAIESTGAASPRSPPREPAAVPNQLHGAVPQGPDAAGQRCHRPPPLPDDHPLEPGSGSPQPAAATPTERIEASLGASAHAQRPGLSQRASLIAAARRAAMAAENKQTIRDAEIAAGGRLAEIGSKFTDWRHQLIVGAGVAALVAGALYLATGMFSQEAAVAPQVLHADPLSQAADQDTNNAAPAPSRARRSIDEAPLPGSVPSDEVGPAESNHQSQAIPDVRSLFSPRPS